MYIYLCLSKLDLSVQCGTHQNGSPRGKQSRLGTSKVPGGPEPRWQKWESKIQGGVRGGSDRTSIEYVGVGGGRSRSQRCPQISEFMTSGLNDT